MCEATKVDAGNKPAKQMQVFRRNEGPPADDYFEIVPHGPVAEKGLEQAAEAGMGDGGSFNMLFMGDDFTLLQAWMKPGYPLPLHTHNTDCLYFVSRGSMKMGTVELNAGDGVFMPAGTPYTVKPGEDGVEFLEFRPKGEYDMQVLSKNQAFWDKALTTIGKKREDWLVQERPS